jgi:DNA-binding MarR family transcriptional regulator
MKAGMASLPVLSSNPRPPEWREYQDRASFLIGAISNLLASKGSQLYRDDFGIGLPEWRLMWVMSHETGLTVQRASRIMGIDKGATSRALAGLNRRGLVRITVDSADSRRRLIEFSDAGRKLRDRMMVVSRERERNLNAIFSEEELTTLRALLRRLHLYAHHTSHPEPAAPIEDRTRDKRGRIRGAAIQSPEAGYPDAVE